MTKHDYTVLGVAFIWLVTNFLGAAYTIRRIQARHGVKFNVGWSGPMDVSFAEFFASASPRRILDAVRELAEAEGTFAAMPKAVKSAAYGLIYAVVAAAHLFSQILQTLISPFTK